MNKIPTRLDPKYKAESSRRYRQRLKENDPVAYKARTDRQNRSVRGPLKRQPNPEAASESSLRQGECIFCKVMFQIQPHQPHQKICKGIECRRRRGREWKQRKRAADRALAPSPQPAPKKPAKPPQRASSPVVEVETAPEPTSTAPTSYNSHRWQQSIPKSNPYRGPQAEFGKAVNGKFVFMPSTEPFWSGG